MADLGDTLTFTASLYDKPPEQGGVLTNAAAVTLTVTLPDGTTVTPTVTNPPSVTGEYTANYTTTLASPSGRYVGQFIFTLDSGNTTSHVETFDVGPSLVTVDEAIAHLRAGGIITKVDDLEQLQWLCQVATDSVERDLGRIILPRTVTEAHQGGGPTILLRSTPVISVTSVADTGVTVTDWVLGSGGVLYRNPGRFSYGPESVTVTYLAGYLDPPRCVRQAALILIQNLWQSSQQASHPLVDEYAENAGERPLWQMQMSPIDQRAYESLRVVGVA